MVFTYPNFLTKFLHLKSFFFKPFIYKGLRGVCLLGFVWSLCGLDGFKRRCPSLEHSFFSLEKLRGAPAQRFEFVQNRNRRTGARPVARGSGAWGSGRATEKRQKIRKKIFEGWPTPLKKNPFSFLGWLGSLYVLPKHSTYLIIFITFVKWK